MRYVGGRRGGVAHGSAKGLWCGCGKWDGAVWVGKLGVLLPPGVNDEDGVRGDGENDVKECCGYVQS